jgi:diguanylate cyclase (GGDEF)-like protein
MNLALRAYLVSQIRVAETTNIEALGLQVRLSMGISIYDVSHGDDATSLLNKADKALYSAKAAGRNNVKLFE